MYINKFIRQRSNLSKIDMVKQEVCVEQVVSQVNLYDLSGYIILFYLPLNII